VANITSLLAAAFAAAVFDCWSAGWCQRTGKLNIDGDDLLGITICQATQKSAEKLPLATRLVRTDHFAVDHAVMDRPGHPTGIGQILVLDPPPTPSRLERSELTRAHGIDECLMKVGSGSFDNLKANHASASHYKLCKELPAGAILRLVAAHRKREETRHVHAISGHFSILINVTIPLAVEIPHPAALRLSASFAKGQRVLLFSRAGDL
jgi:hypothetical protein